MSRVEAPPFSLAPASASGLALLQVSWDQTPDLDQFLRFIHAYSKGRFSASLAEKITLASTELLDNAVRYGSLARDYAYCLEQGSSRITVSVQNTAIATRVEMLNAQLRRLETTPEQVYASELERSMTPGGRRSMLGLARIRHEAEMRLEISVHDGQVTVRASCAR